MGKGNTAQNKEVYCKLCYGKSVGLQGYGFGSTASLTSVGGMETKGEYHYNSFF